MPLTLPLYRIVVQYDRNARTLNGLSSDAGADNVAFSSVMPGGYNACTFRMQDSERTAHSNVYRYGARVTVYIGQNQPFEDQLVWQGYMKEATPNDDPTSTISAVGFKDILLKRSDNLLWQTFDGWESADDKPFDPYFNNHNAIDVKTSGAHVLFHCAKGSAVAAAQSDKTPGRSWAFWFNGAPPDGYAINRVAGTLRQNVGVPKTSGGTPLWALRLRRFAQPSVGASGAITETTYTTALADANANDVATVLGTPQPMVGFELARMVGTNDSTENYRVRITSTRVNGDAYRSTPPDWDTYKIHSIIGDMAGPAGFTTGKVSSSSTTNMLPAWLHDGNWFDFMEHLCAKAGGFKLGVWEIVGGGPEIEARSWATGTSWYVRCYGASATAVANVDPSDDVYAKVAVRYRLAGSRKHHTVTAYTAQSSLANLVPPRADTFHFMLSEAQNNSAHATDVAANLAAELSLEQYAGTIRLHAARVGSITGTNKHASMIRAGDTITVPDHPDGSKTFRIYSTDTDEQGTTLTVGRKPGKFERVGWLRKHHWFWNRGHWQHLGHVAHHRGG